ncbi:MAG: aconitate hydratase AcnA [Hyphomicrobiaceae bacterium]
MTAQAQTSLDSFNCRKTLTAGEKTYTYYSLPDAARNGLGDISALPYSLKVLLENLLRHEDGRSVTKDDILATAKWRETKGKSSTEIGFRPARVMMQDFTGVPAVVDLAAMRDGMTSLGGDPRKINPLVPVDLIIDHSVIVDAFGNEAAYARNVELEYARNGERYNFLKWGQSAFDNFRVVPPGTGICHQINLEYLSQVVWTREIGGKVLAYPDTVVGTDSHTTMVNGLSVLGWGVGGIEAEAAMLGQPQSMLVPEVIGFRLTGRLKEGVTSTDLVLTVTQMLRKKGVVAKFVEFFGPGLDAMTLADRGTISNMAPEYGATCGFFPVDAETLNYLRVSGRANDRIALVEAYTKAQDMFRTSDTSEPVFTDTLDLDLGDVVPSLAGPKRPEGRISLENVKSGFATALENEYRRPATDIEKRVDVANHDFDLGHGDVVIAAITSCTNTSNPSVLIAAGLLARNAVQKGLTTKPWVKTSLAPGSQVVAAYLEKAGLQSYLDQIGFNLVGFGCTTCIGNSGPLQEDISRAINENGIVASAVLSGNRNFEGRVSPDVQANYLASPPLVVAYALAGTVNQDLSSEPLGKDDAGKPVFLRDIWPTNQEIQQFISENIDRDMFQSKYSNVFEGDENWKDIKTSTGLTYGWDSGSTYVQNPPYFEGITKELPQQEDVIGARILGLFGDKITTDHISPAGAIKKESPAGEFLLERQVRPQDFNQYGTRRGNHDIMMRGTFANIRIKNHAVKAADGTIPEGGYAIHYPSGERMFIFDAAERYRKEGVPLVVMAGVEYGNGSSRDWAAKGTSLLGVRAVIAQSFERIHRSNLVGMGVVPFTFEDSLSWEKLGIRGDEMVTIRGFKDIEPRKKMVAEITFADGSKQDVPILCRIDTLDELDYVRNGGILHYVLRNLSEAA